MTSPNTIAKAAFCLLVLLTVVEIVGLQQRFNAHDRTVAFPVDRKPSP